MDEPSQFVKEFTAAFEEAWREIIWHGTGNDYDYAELRVYYES